MQQCFRNFRSSSGVSVVETIVQQRLRFYKQFEVWHRRHPLRLLPPLLLLLHNLRTLTYRNSSDCLGTAIPGTGTTPATTTTTRRIKEEETRKGKDKAQNSSTRSLIRIAFIICFLKLSYISKTNTYVLIPFYILSTAAVVTIDSEKMIQRLPAFAPVHNVRLGRNP